MAELSILTRGLQLTDNSTNHAISNFTHFSRLTALNKQYRSISNLQKILLNYDVIECNRRGRGPSILVLGGVLPSSTTGLGN